MKKILFVLVSAILCVSIYADNLNKIVEESFDVNKWEKLYLDTDNGDVIIKSWDKNVVTVKVLGNKKAESKMNFELIKKEKEVYVRGEKKGSNFFNFFSNVHVRYEIMVPDKYNVEIKTAGGDIIVANIEGKILLKTSGGDIDLDRTKGTVEATTSGGDVTADCDYGDLNVSTSGGDIKLKTRSGKIKAHTSGGDVTLNYIGENMGIELGTSGGDIDVYLENGIKANAELKTSGGDIKIEFPTTSMEKMTSSKFIGKLNGGGNSISCYTSGGDISLREIGK